MKYDEFNEFLGKKKCYRRTLIWYGIKQLDVLFVKEIWSLIYDSNHNQKMKQL